MPSFLVKSHPEAAHTTGPPVPVTQNKFRTVMIQRYMYKTSLPSRRIILYKFLLVDDILGMGEIWIGLKTHIIIQPVKGTRLQHRHEGLADLQFPIEVEVVRAVQQVPRKMDQAFHSWLRLHWS